MELVSSFESIESSSKNGDIINYLIKGKADTKRKRPIRGNNVVNLEDIPLRGPRKKIPHTLPP